MHGQIVSPYLPKIIVYHRGSNDINANVSPKQIAGNFRRFVTCGHKKLIRMSIFFVSIHRAPEKMATATFQLEINHEVSDIFPLAPFRQLVVQPDGLGTN